MKNESKIIVVTGASSGIGFAIASHLHETGARVFGISRSGPKDKFAFSYIPADVTNAESLERAAAIIHANAGRVDVLVNCAGIGIGGAIEETTEDAFDRIFAVNVKGTFLTTRTFLPLLRESELPKVINIGSVAGTLTIPFQAFYSMTKAAVVSFSEALRMETKPLGIDVTSILPGDTKTAFTQNREKNDSLSLSPYKERSERSLQRMEKDEQKGRSPLSVAKAVARLVNRKSMPVQLTIGFEYKLFLFLNRILPRRLVNWILYQMYGK